MPAEWEPHASTWLAWPHRLSDWPGKFATIPWVYAEILRILGQHERVNVVVRDDSMKKRVAAILSKLPLEPDSVRLHKIPTDRSWVRDSGPIFTLQTDNQKVALDWRFNAWAKYEDWPTDDKLPAAVAKILGVERVQPHWGNHRVVLEGGSIDVNGSGLMLTTEECLLSKIQERNPVLVRTDYEAVFEQYLGVKKVLWLGSGIIGDDTHGHVDDLARFVNRNTIVLVKEKNEADANFALLQENWDRVSEMRNIKGEKLEVVALPMPSPVVFRGQRLPASYANFYIANGVVLVPTFNDPQDRVALGILADLFPDREVIGIHCVDLVWGLGTLHCMTQQEPACKN
jgi:agmatine deiminase